MPSIPQSWRYDPRRLKEVNPERIVYLADLLGLSRQEVCELVRDGRKTEVKEEDLFGTHIQTRYLEKLEEVLGKCHAFLGSTSPLTYAKNSILCRKERHHNCELQYADRLLVSMTEDEALRQSGICVTLWDRLNRILPRYSLADNPVEVAYEVRAEMEIREQPYKDIRKHLHYLMRRLGKFHIIVREHVESPKHKNNLAGFFLRPLTIVIKRQQHVGREIFTLAHELGHYLLDKEELDGLPFDKENSKEEKWCNDFAFAFILGRDKIKQLKSFKPSEVRDPFGTIAAFSSANHISRLAIYCHLAKRRVITWKDYNEIKSAIRARHEQEERAYRRKANGTRSRQGGRKLRPLFSPLEQKIYLNAFYAGIVKEHRLMRHFQTHSIDSIVCGAHF